MHIFIHLWNNIVEGMTILIISITELFTDKLTKEISMPYTPHPPPQKKKKKGEIK